METDFLLLDLPLIVYAGGSASQTEEVISPAVSNSVSPPKMCSNLHHASSVDEVSQYYVLPNKQDKLGFVVCDTPEDNLQADPELLLSGQSSPLQTIFSIRASGKPNYLGARVPVPTSLGC